MQHHLLRRPPTVLEQRVAQDQAQARAATHRCQYLIAELIREKLEAEKAARYDPPLGLGNAVGDVFRHRRPERFTFQKRPPYPRDQLGITPTSRTSPLIPRIISIGGLNLHLAYIDAGDHSLLRHYGQGLRPDGKQFYGLAGLPAFAPSLVNGDSTAEDNASTGVYVENTAPKPPQWIPRSTKVGGQPHSLAWLSDLSIALLRAHGQGMAADGSQNYGPGKVPAFFGSNHGTDEVVPPLPRPEPGLMATPLDRPEPPRMGTPLDGPGSSMESYTSVQKNNYKTPRVPESVAPNKPHHKRNTERFARMDQKPTSPNFFNDEPNPILSGQFGDKNPRGFFGGGGDTGWDNSNRPMEVRNYYRISDKGHAKDPRWLPERERIVGSGLFGDIGGTPYPVSAGRGNNMAYDMTWQQAEQLKQFDRRVKSLRERGHHESPAGPGQLREQLNLRVPTQPTRSPGMMDYVIGAGQNIIRAASEALPDLDDRSWNRILGAGQMAVGATESIAGIPFAGSPTPAAPLGVAAVIHGLDNFHTGYRQLVTGTPAKTQTYRAIRNVAEAFGAEADTAERVANTFDQAATMFPPAAAIHSAKGAAFRWMPPALPSAAKRPLASALTKRVPEAIDTLEGWLSLGGDIQVLVENAETGTWEDWGTTAASAIPIILGNIGGKRRPSQRDRLYEQFKANYGSQQDIDLNPFDRRRLKELKEALKIPSDQKHKVRPEIVATRKRLMHILEGRKGIDDRVTHALTDATNSSLNTGIPMKNGYLPNRVNLVRTRLDGGKDFVVIEWDEGTRKWYLITTVMDSH